MSESPIPKRRGRGKSKLKGTVLTRSARALSLAQIPIQRVDVDSLTGRFSFIVGQPGEVGPDAWDKAIEKLKASK
jgi:hypothetical protein